MHFSDGLKEESVAVSCPCVEALKSLPRRKWHKDTERPMPPPRPPTCVDCCIVTGGH